MCANCGVALASNARGVEIVTLIVCMIPSPLLTQHGFWLGLVGTLLWAYIIAAVACVFITVWIHDSAI